MSAYKFSISMNPSLIDKHVGGDKRLFAHGWENVELCHQEIGNIVQRGIALCAQVKGGYRTKKLFLCSGAAFVDVDHRLTMEEALRLPIVHDHATLIYTTCSHTAEAPRFRIVFGLERIITCADELQALQKALALRIGGDLAATDAARISFGSTNAEVIYRENILSEPLISELIQQGLHAPIRQSSGWHDEKSARSALVLQETQPLRLADGTETTLRDAPAKASVYCPFHNDNRPSAFIVSSQRGIRGLRCSACVQTYWPKNAPPHDFDNFIKTVKSAAVYADTEMDGGPLGTFMDPPRKRSSITGSRICVKNGQATPSTLGPGLTFIRSPKGTGKTEGIISLTRSVSRVLLIGHRRALIRTTAERLGLTCYLDQSEGKLTQARLAVCLDSLNRVGDARFDCVILDESESVLRHLLSDTLGAANRLDRSYYWGLLSSKVRSAKHVLALDADLGWVTFDTLTAMAPRHSASVWLNEDDSKTAGKPIDVYESDKHLLGELLERVASGGRYYVASNSKKKVGTLSLAIEKATNGKARQILVTADTIDEEPVRRLLKNVKEEALKYSVIHASPSVGTGVDITFPDGACEFDAVYGFFEADITSHFEVDQQLARVRNPGAVKVWISPQRLHYETDISVVRQELMSQSVYEHLIVDDDSEGGPQKFRQGGLTDLASLIHSEDRASRNALKSNFINHKLAQGYIVNFIERQPEPSAKGSDAFSAAKKARVKERVRSLLAARKLSLEDYKEVRNRANRGQAVTGEERWALKREEIERFYGCPISANLIEQDDDGHFREKVRLFEGLFDIHLARLNHSAVALSEAAIRERSLPRQVLLLHKLLDAAGLSRITEYKQGGFLPTHVTELDTKVELSSGSMGAFVEALRSHKRQVATQLHLDVRKDCEQKPIQELTRLLGMAGLKLTPPRIERKGGQKVYWYRLDSAALNKMQKVMAKRSSEERWNRLEEAEKVEAA